MDWIEAAQHILSISPEPLLYARVDGVERAGRFMLKELEIKQADREERVLLRSERSH